MKIWNILLKNYYKYFYKYVKLNMINNIIIFEFINFDMKNYIKYIYKNFINNLY